MRASWVALPIAVQAYWVGASAVMATLRPDWLARALTEPTLPFASAWASRNLIEYVEIPRDACMPPPMNVSARRDESQGCARRHARQRERFEIPLLRVHPAPGKGPGSRLILARDDPRPKWRGRGDFENDIIRLCGPDVLNLELEHDLVPVSPRVEIRHQDRLRSRAQDKLLQGDPEQAKGRRCPTEQPEEELEGPLACQKFDGRSQQRRRRMQQVRDAAPRYDNDSNDEAALPHRDIRKPHHKEGSRVRVHGELRGATAEPRWARQIGGEGGMLTGLIEPALSIENAPEGLACSDCANPCAIANDARSKCCRAPAARRELVERLRAELRAMRGDASCA